MNQNINRRSADSAKLRGKCPTGKTRFRDHQESVSALHRSANHRVVDLSERGFTKRQEIRSYPCDLCSGWHLTSKATWDSRKEAA
jgi:hypothetical protein